MLTLQQEQAAREEQAKREAEQRKERVLQKRVERDLKRAMQGDRISLFLKRQADKNSSVNAAVNQVQAIQTGTVGLQTVPSVQYQPFQQPVERSYIPAPFMERATLVKTFTVCEDGVPVKYDIPCWNKKEV